MMRNHKKTAKIRRLTKVRSKTAVSNRYRLTVHRSNRYIYATILEAVGGAVLAQASSKDIKTGKKEAMTKTVTAREVGKLIASRLPKGKKKEVFFDRGQYRYHGRVKSLADGAREGGLIF
jgi:large subunit ribosomal protein L18